MKDGTAKAVSLLLVLGWARSGEAVFCGARQYEIITGTQNLDGNGTVSVYACASCPENTARLLNDAATAGGPGSTLAECVCEPGYYSPEGGKAGVACKGCPPGGLCDGRGAAPRAVEGHFRAAATFTGHSHGERGALVGVASLPTRRERFLPCTPSSSCERTHAAAFVSAQETSQWDEGDDSTTVEGGGYPFEGNAAGTTNCAGHRLGVRCDGVEPGFRLAGAGVFEFQCVPGLEGSAGKAQHGGRNYGGFAWSLVVALACVLAWSWCALFLLRAQSSRPPLQPVSWSSSFPPLAPAPSSSSSSFSMSSLSLGGSDDEGDDNGNTGSGPCLWSARQRAWRLVGYLVAETRRLLFGVGPALLQRVGPLDAALLVQLACLALRLPLAWPRAGSAAGTSLLQLLQASSAFFLFDVAVWTPCGGWAFLASSESVSAGALFGEGTSASKLFGGAAAVGGGHSSTFGGVLRAHTFLTLVLLVLPFLAVKHLTFANAKKVSKGTSKRAAQVLRNRRRQQQQRWHWGGGGSNGGGVASGLLSSAMASAAACVCGDDPTTAKKHHPCTLDGDGGRTTRAGAASLEAWALAAVAGRLLLPAACLRLAQSWACVDFNDGSRWVLADAGVTECGGKRQAGLVLEASFCLWLVLWVCGRQGGVLGRLLRRHRKSSSSPPAQWLSLQWAIPAGTVVTTTNNPRGGPPSSSSPTAPLSFLLDAHVGLGSQPWAAFLSPSPSPSDFDSDGMMNEAGKKKFSSSSSSSSTPFSSLLAWASPLVPVRGPFSLCLWVVHLALKAVRMVTPLDWVWTHAASPLLTRFVLPPLAESILVGEGAPGVWLCTVAAVCVASQTALHQPVSASALLCFAELVLLVALPLCSQRGNTCAQEAASAVLGALTALAALFAGCRFRSLATSPGVARNFQDNPGQGDWGSSLADAIAAMLLWAVVLLPLTALVLEGGLRQRVVKRNRASLLTAALSSAKAMREAAAATVPPLKTVKAAARRVRGVEGDEEYKEEPKGGRGGKGATVLLSVDLKRLETFASSAAAKLQVRQVLTGVEGGSAKLAEMEARKGVLDLGGLGQVQRQQAAFGASALAGLSGVNKESGGVPLFRKAVESANLFVTAEVRVPRSSRDSDEKVFRRDLVFVTTRFDDLDDEEDDENDFADGGFGVGGDFDFDDDDGGGDDPTAPPRSPFHRQPKKKKNKNNNGRAAWVPLSAHEGHGEFSAEPFVVPLPIEARGRATLHLTVATREGEVLALWDAVVPGEKSHEVPANPLLAQAAASHWGPAEVGMAGGAREAASLDVLPLFSPLFTSDDGDRVGNGAAAAAAESEVMVGRDAVSSHQHPWMLFVRMGYIGGASTSTSSSSTSTRDGGDVMPVKHQTHDQGLQRAADDLLLAPTKEAGGSAAHVARRASEIGLLSLLSPDPAMRGGTDDDLAWALTRGLQVVDSAFSALNLGVSCGGGCSRVAGTGLGVGSEVAALCKVLAQGASAANGHVAAVKEVEALRVAKAALARDEAAAAASGLAEDDGPAGGVGGALRSESRRSVLLAKREAELIHKAFVSFDEAGAGTGGTGGSGGGPSAEVSRAHVLVKLLLSLAAGRDVYQRRTDGVGRQRALERMAAFGEELPSSSSWSLVSRMPTGDPFEEEGDDAEDESDGAYARFLSRLVEAHPGLPLALASYHGSSFHDSDRESTGRLLERFKAMLRAAPSDPLRRFGAGRRGGEDGEGEEEEEEEEWADDEETDVGGNGSSSSSSHFSVWRAVKAECRAPLAVALLEAETSKASAATEVEDAAKRRRGEERKNGSQSTKKKKASGKKSDVEEDDDGGDGEINGSSGGPGKKKAGTIENAEKEPKDSGKSIRKKVNKGESSPLDDDDGNYDEPLSSPREIAFMFLRQLAKSSSPRTM